MQVRKQQLELDMEQQTGSKYEKGYVIPGVVDVGVERFEVDREIARLEHFARLGKGLDQHRALILIALAGQLAAGGDDRLFAAGGERVVGDAVDALQTLS